MSVELEPMIRAAVAAALRKVRLPETRWGTVEEYTPESEQITVIVDGDTLATPATNATGTGFAVGQRVLVLHSPPSGAHIIGYRPAPPIPYTPALDNIDVGSGGVIYGEYVFSGGGMVDFAVSIELGTGSSVSGEISVGLPLVGAALETTSDPWIVNARALVGGHRFQSAGVYRPTTTDLFVGAFGGEGAANTWDTTTPDPWADGDTLRVTGRYPRRLPVQNLDAG